VRLTYGRSTAVYTVMYYIVSVQSLVFVQCTRIRWWYQWPHFMAVFTAVILLATLAMELPKSKDHKRCGFWTGPCQSGF
jgi:hypothetical protein